MREGHLEKVVINISFHIDCTKPEIFVFVHVLKHAHTRTHTHNIAKKYILYQFCVNKLSIRFYHILLGQLHQENDSGHGINYACPWPKTKHRAEGEGHTHM